MKQAKWAKYRVGARVTVRGVARIPGERPATVEAWSYIIAWVSEKPSSAGKESRKLQRVYTGAHVRFDEPYTDHQGFTVYTEYFGMHNLRFIEENA